MGHVAIEADLVSEDVLQPRRLRRAVLHRHCGLKPCVEVGDWLVAEPVHLAAQRRVIYEAELHGLVAVDVHDSHAAAPVEGRVRVAERPRVAEVLPHLVVLQGDHPAAEDAASGPCPAERPVEARLVAVLDARELLGGERGERARAHSLRVLYPSASLGLVRLQYRVQPCLREKVLYRVLLARLRLVLQSLQVAADQLAELACVNAPLGELRRPLPERGEDAGLRHPRGKEGAVFEPRLDPRPLRAVEVAADERLPEYEFRRSHCTAPIAAIAAFCPAATRTSVSPPPGKLSKNVTVYAL